MTRIRKDGTEYVGYEYKEKSVPALYASLYLDSYPCFGWEEDPNGMSRKANTETASRAVLRFRRDRKLCNRAELTRLQRNFDSCVAEIDALEQSKRSSAVIGALVTGIMGTAFMAGSVFAVTAEPPMVVLCILLAVPGFTGWIVPYFLYRALLRKKSAKVSPLIEDKYEEIYEICEKGSDLLI